jgi:hypothetical protein
MRDARKLPPTKITTNQDQKLRAEALIGRMIPSDPFQSHLILLQEGMKCLVVHLATIGTMIDQGLNMMNIQRKVLPTKRDQERSQ